ncbi:MAG: hypothetical protein AMK71_11570 [Nitrospira bacterium SG8_35_4]|nr:MAG: hypothetical protein AMK71_11570 [Nitrospira bacterium SG8_35_4]
MFLTSIVSGLKIFTYWETYAAGLVLLISFLVPVSIIGISNKNKKCEGFGCKCMTILIFPALQVIGVTIFVLTLAPIILGLSETASWGFPWRMISLAPLEFSIFVGVFAVIAVAFAITPYLRKLYPFQTMIIGCMSLVLVEKFLGLINPTLDIGFVTLYPGFRFLTGILFMTWIMSTAGLHVSSVIGAKLGNRLNVGKDIMELLIFPFAAAFGIIPVFTYGAWLA